MHEQDRVGSPAADVAAGGQCGLLLGAEVLPAVRAHEQPVGAGPGRRAPVVVVEDGDPAQRVSTQIAVPTVVSAITSAIIDRIPPIRRAQLALVRVRLCRTGFGAGGVSARASERGVTAVAACGGAAEAATGVAEAGDAGRRCRAVR